MQMNDQESVDDFEHNEELKMAGFGPRWGAFLIDLNILFVVVMIFFDSALTILRSGSIDPGSLSDSVIVGGFITYFVGIPVAGVLYQALFDCSKFQGTPGKIAVKIKVVNKNGDRINFLQALGRNSGKYISSLILYVGFLMAIWTEQKQTLHDIMANTYVVLNR